MNNIFAFNDKNEALTAISKELLSDDWKKAVMIDQNGEMTENFVEKEKVKQFNDITPFGGFDNEETADSLLHDCLILQLDEIIEWLVEGNNLPLKLFFTFDESIGYCFDEQGNEIESNKLQLCLRKDRKNNTHFGMFVSHFHPVREFIK